MPQLANPHPPNNLVLPRSPLIGRSDILDKAQHILLQEDVELLTLTGTGGIGKTRLALQVAANVLDHFLDGVYFVSLAPISNAALVLPAIAQVLGVRETGAHSLTEDVLDSLRAKQLLLVLDNFEQVLPAAPIVAQLLRACPRLKALATSRAPLRLYGEHEFPVPPLALPDPKELTQLQPGAGSNIVSGLRQYAAVELFCRRAAAVQSGFALTPDNAAAVAKICIGLDGLPLAIELAAARIKLFGPSTLLALLQKRLALLTGGAQDLPLRQRTLRDEIAWSYNLLQPEEQLLFRRLAVFAGGFTLEAATAVGNLNGDPALNVLDSLASLVDQSLVRQLEQPQGDQRFGMLETIREYALEQLTASGEAETVCYYHATYFLVLAETIEPDLLVPATKPRAKERLLADFDNLRAVMAWTIQPRGTATAMNTAEMAVRLAGAMSWFGMEMMQQIGEVRSWLAAALRQPLAPGPALAKALWGAGLLAMIQGDYGEARHELVRSAEIYRSHGDQPGLARALRELCITAYAEQEFPASQSYGEESAALFRALGNRSDLALTLDNLAATYVAQAQYASARTLYEEEYALCHSLEDPPGCALAIVGLGVIAAQLGDDAAAIGHLEQALVIQREMGGKWVLAVSLNLLGELVQRRGEWERAAGLYRESLILVNEIDDKANIAQILHQIAMLAHAQKQDPHAARLFAVAEAHRAAAGGAIFFTLTSSSDRAESIAAVRTQLGEEQFAACWTEGQSMTLEQAIALAVVATNTPPTLPSPYKSSPEVAQQPANHANLTPREIEVLRLLAQRLTYTEIADTLVISRRTVNAHVTSIYAKLGVTSRADAVRFASEF